MKKTCTVDGCTRSVLARRYCAPHYSTWHRAQLKYRITCAECGREARMGHAKAKYCSKTCSAKASQAAATAGRVKQQHHQKHWAGTQALVRVGPSTSRRTSKRPRVCLLADCADNPASRGMCLTHYDVWQRHKRMPARFTAGQCRVCGAGFISTIRNDITCSPTCQAVQRKHLIHTCNARRRARLRAAFVADVSRHKVFEQDGYRCHLCGKKTLRTKRSPHPRSPSVDHVIPLARGGTHEPANCRTACLRCNVAKGARGGGEQMTLPA